MKIPVVKTDVPLDRGAKEKLRMEIEKAVKTGIVILDGGLDIAMIEVEDSNIVNETFIEAKTFSPAQGETEAVEYIGGPIIGSCVSEGVLNHKEPEPLKTSKATPLLQIELDNITSVPHVLYKGEEIKNKVRVDFSYLTGDEYGIKPIYIDIVAHREDGSVRAISHNQGAISINEKRLR
ncbi:hypothetical protein [Bacillus velezensis]|nr:hypothetical protein [Bacillus velezensis]WBY44569.1 hypothetical protein PF996_14205 [Bacillus velezensis]WDV98965.1 hypothetical protein PWA59_14125 [Bacillus velezensis]WMX43333.1 hypothetical protein RGQ10_09870 [Bacillus velezensis]WPH26311.1 hypothetical protein SD459_13335 [Bacillus velezensis]CCG50650.1 hypothetical protein BANAU_2629 [Bacillus velezensis YAU B9601-Y2]